jgi:serine/threonine protein kinase
VSATGGRFDKYQLIAELGHGGMADVFLAAVQGPTGFSKLLVIKRLRPDLVEDAEFVNMLLDEARLAARLNHPNVVQTIEVGKVDRHYFIAMEYLEGQPLHRVLSRAQRQNGGMPKELQYLVLSDALAGLHYAHELRDYDATPIDVVHRDVTPHNVFITYAGQVKVVDFGIAKAQGRTTNTSTGVVKGKVKYMAPEQALGEDVDRRVDIFSAGIMLWEAATGKRMWGTPKEDIFLLQKILSGDFNASPRQADPSVPEALDAICRKALAFDRADRYATAADFQADLDAHLDEIYAEKAGKADEAPASSHRRRLANRDLGRYVATLFEDSRREMRELIERQMAALATASDPTMVSTVQAPGVVRGSSDHSWRDEGTPRDEASDSALRRKETTGKTEANLTASRPLRTSTRSGAVLAVAAVVVGGVVAFTLAPRIGSTPPVSSVIEQKEAVTPSALPARVQLSLRATPAEAVFYLDGTRLQGNPFSGSFDAGEEARRLRVEAAGYQPSERAIVLRKDLELELSLEPSASPSIEPSTEAPPAPNVARPHQPSPNPVPAQPDPSGPIRPIDEKPPW